MNEVIDSKSPREKMSLDMKARVPFTNLEKNSRQAIRKCVESLRVEPAWSISNWTKLSSPDLARKCVGKELDFLTDTLSQNCPFTWKDAQVRTEFYYLCLEKFPIDNFAEKAVKERRRLERSAYSVNKFYRKKGKWQIGGGSAMIAGI